MFEDFKFSSRQILNYLVSAKKDLKIAFESKAPEVLFTFSYNAIIKISIAVCALRSLRVKSRQGHHMALINKLAGFLDDDSIDKIGNKMRKLRNKDLYKGGVVMTIKQAEEYLNWTKKIYDKVEVLIKKNPKLPLK